MNKKRILMSLGVITVVAAVVIGGTIAYFSDTETSTGNTFSTGVIDISIDDQNPWTESWNIGDMKPCETGYITFNIRNPGDNPVNIWKTVTVTETIDTPINEPECVYGGGVWDSNAQACCKNCGTGYIAKSNLHNWMNYDLSVRVPIPDNNDGAWWQTIYKDEDDVRVASINGKSILLGMIPAGGTMEVTQSYHLIPETDNWAQADTMKFDITIYGEQLTGSLILENKSGNPDWQINDDGIKGTLTYNLTSPTFDYDFEATGLTNENWQLIYYPDPWNASKQVLLIGSPMLATGGAINVSNRSVNLGVDLPDWSTWADQNHPEGAKIWLVPTASLSSNTLGWINPGTFLYETALMTYDDTDN